MIHGHSAQEDLTHGPEALSAAKTEGQLETIESKEDELFDAEKFLQKQGRLR